MAFIMVSCRLTDLCTHLDDLLDCVSLSRKMYSLHASNSIYKHLSDSVSVASDVAPRHIVLTGLYVRRVSARTLLPERLTQIEPS